MNASLPPISAGILIGGAARRMGRPKQWLQIEGRTFLERIAETLSACCRRVVLLGEGTVPKACSKLPRLHDASGLCGPVAGLLAAMRDEPSDAWIFVGCDQPLISAAAIEWLLKERHPEAWAVLPRLAEGGVEPLLALYEPPCLELLETIVARGGRAPSALEGHPRVHSPVPPRKLARAWLNVNSPQDLVRLL